MITLFIICISFLIGLFYYYLDSKKTEVIKWAKIPLYSKLQLRANLFFRTLYLSVGISCVYWVFKGLEILFITLIN